MKKPKQVRKAIRDEKHKQKLTDNASFIDVLKASANHAKKTAKKGKKVK